MYAIDDTNVYKGFSREDFSAQVADFDVTVITVPNLVESIYVDS